MSMTINFKDSSKMVVFSELKTGDVFEYSDTVFLMISNGEDMFDVSDYRAVVLCGDGNNDYKEKLFSIKNYQFTYVKLLKAHLEIER